MNWLHQLIISRKSVCCAHTAIATTTIFCTSCCRIPSWQIQWTACFLFSSWIMFRFSRWEPGNAYDAQSNHVEKYKSCSRHLFRECSVLLSGSQYPPDIYKPNINVNFACIVWKCARLGHIQVFKMYSEGIQVFKSIQKEIFLDTCYNLDPSVKWHSITVI